MYVHECLLKSGRNANRDCKILTRVEEVAKPVIYQATRRNSKHQAACFSCKQISSITSQSLVSSLWDRRQ